MQKIKIKKKHKKKFKNQNLKLLNYKDVLMGKKKTLILKNNQINFVKNQKTKYDFYLGVISQTNFFHSLTKI